MHAIAANRFLPVTDPECLIDVDLPEPSLLSRDLLVEVVAIGVNPVDTKIRATLGELPLDPPRVLGWDAAGRVLAVGPEVAGFSVGDEVFYAGDLTRAGCNARRQAVDSRLVALKPASLSFEDAAALPLVALTAWELLFERMGLDPDGADRGRSLLVINGAGGVGSALIPLARRAGLRVVATASRPATIDWCVKLGAEATLDHHQPLEPQAAALGFTHFDAIACLHSTEAYWETMGRLVAPLGSVGLIVEPKRELPLGDPYKAKCVRIAWEFMAARARFQTPDLARQGEILATIARLCEQGQFPVIRSRSLRPIAAATLRQAHAAMERSSAHGKWVLTDWPEDSAS